MCDQRLPKQRWIYGGVALFCFALIGVALYFQYAMGLEPCPLCIFQRVVVIALGLLMGLALMLNPGGLGRKCLGITTAFMGLVGSLIAGRQVWLQHLPEEQVPACGPGLDYMMEMFPVGKVLDLVFRGSGECAEVHWRMLGLSIAEWMLLIFVFFILFGAWLTLVRLSDRIKGN